MAYSQPLWWQPPLYTRSINEIPLSPVVPWRASGNSSVEILSARLKQRLGVLEVGSCMTPVVLWVQGWCRCNLHCHWQSLFHLLRP